MMQGVVGDTTEISASKIGRVVSDTRAKVKDARSRSIGADYWDYLLSVENETLAKREYYDPSSDVADKLLEKRSPTRHKNGNTTPATKPDVVELIKEIADLPLFNYEGQVEDKEKIVDSAPEGKSEETALLFEELELEPAKPKKEISEESYLDDPFLDQLGEYEEEIRDYDVDEIEIDGSLDRYERAHQIAVEVAAKYDFSTDYGLSVIEEIFVRYGWGNTKDPVENLLDKGIDEESLKRIFDIKCMWEDDDRFTSKWKFTWANAKEFHEFFGESMEIEEICYHLAELYQKWQDSIESSRLRYEAYYDRCDSYFPRAKYRNNKTNFLRFIYGIMGVWPSFYDYRLQSITEDYYEDDNPDDLRCSLGSPTYNYLNERGISCDIWMGPSREHWLGPKQTSEEEEQ